MPTVRHDDTVPGRVGIGLIALPPIFCAMQAVPGWSPLEVPWPRSAYYAIMAACWAVGWLLSLPRHPVPGLLGGLVGGPSCLFAMVALLENTTWTHPILLIAVGMLGSLPGVLVYAALSAAQDRLFPPPPEPPAEPTPTRQTGGMTATKPPEGG